MAIWLLLNNKFVKWQQVLFYVFAIVICTICFLVQSMQSACRNVHIKLMKWSMQEWLRTESEQFICYNYWYYKKSIRFIGTVVKWIYVPFCYDYDQYQIYVHVGWTLISEWKWMNSLNNQPIQMDFAVLPFRLNSQHC